tara:strand:+ start:1934 stop:3313 length:1380 start_codon:yes stop_codon:yes gene_type:complete
VANFDVVIVGAGPGGYPAAIRAAQLGASVALIEKEAAGGTCLNWGCIPSKTLIATAEAYHRLRAIPGLHSCSPTLDYAALVEHKNGVVKKLQSGVQQLLKANGVRSISGTASFTSRNRLAVTGSETIEAGHTILATGCTSLVPSFLPAHERIVDSRAFLDRVDLPKRLIILGGGIIGCEFACMAANLGAEVTIVEMLDDILLTLDPEIRATLRDHMEKAIGITVMTGAPLDEVSANNSCVQGNVGDKTIEGDLLIVAVGRAPATGKLGLEHAGIATDESGFITVDDFGMTSAATVYAIGDVNGRTQLAHAATSQGITVAENIVRKERTRMETLIPAAVFTSPEIGVVGLTEEEAAATGIDVLTGKFAFAGLGKAIAVGETVGFVKWVADKATDRLLGAHVIGAHATDLIAEAAVAIRSELTLEEIGRTVHSHPTLSEAWMEAAHAAHGTAIHAPPSRGK